MKIEIWDGGLQEQEIDAINKIAEAFSDGQPEAKLQVRGGSMSCTRFRGQQPKQI